MVVVLVWAGGRRSSPSSCVELSALGILLLLLVLERLLSYLLDVDGMLGFLSFERIKKQYIIIS